MKKIRIGILGIGGTGGFFGGKLAKYYKNDENIEVILIARGESKRKILQNGLIIESIEGDFTIKPDIVSDDTTQIGSLDILLVCVKSYGLEKAVNQYKGNMKKGGVVITIQNLVNQVERIEKILPEEVFLLEGCAYIISNIVDFGHIKHKGGPTTIYFGRNENIEKFRWVEEIFTNSGIRATLSNDISRTIWRKFLLISPLAVATSCFACSIGELRKDPEKLLFLKRLMEELFELIQRKNIGLKPEEIENHLKILEEFPEKGKTSMQLDIENGKPSEIDSLLDYVLQEATTYNLIFANYTKASENLKK